MTRSLLRWALILSGVCLLPIAVIRAQPYDDSELRAFLTPPDGCPVPCFMGLRPGVTTTGEALAILGNHEWVKDLGDINLDDFPDPSNIPISSASWRWNSLGPQWLSSTGRYMDGLNGSFWVEDGKVVSLEMDTSIHIGDLILVFGIPDKTAVLSYDGLSGDRVYDYSAWYRDEGIIMSTSGMCPFTSLYMRPVMIRFQEHAPEFSESDTLHPGCRR